jgi:anthranilate synthase/aminodeoxychorismate synthase-like glutamine amidotransferase
MEESYREGRRRASHAPQAVILLIDNYDSFTFNLAQAMQARGVEVRVVRSDSLDASAALALAPRGIVLGPGPGKPRDATLCHALLTHAPASLPILGVCLGHQALCEHYGAIVSEDPTPVHGRASAVHHVARGWLADLPNPFDAGRYHSLAALREPWPEALVLEGWTLAGLPMIVRHREQPRFGVQFHPESILSPVGPALLARFLERCGEHLAPHDSPILRPLARPTDAG